VDSEVERVSVEFGVFRFEPRAGLLFEGDQLVALGRRGAQLLDALLHRRGEVLTKDELIQAAWPDTAIEESNLSVQIAQLRKALGQTADGKDWIATVPRVGYRFAASEEPGAPERPADASRLPSLAVLAFDNLGDDPSQRYFADGIVEDLITGLSRFRSFDVIARNSSFAYRGRALDVRKVARELGVRYVLEGSVRRVGPRLRVTAQLIDGEDGAHLWAHTYDGDMEDVFDVQDRITESVAAFVEPRIGHAEIMRSRRQRPQSVAAYDLYLRAQFALQVMSQEGIARAYQLFSEALVLEPENVMFLSGASEAIQNRISQGFPPFGLDDRERCLDLARRGLRLAGNDASAIALFGMSLMNAREHELGYATVLRAVKLNPNSLMVMLSAGIACLQGGNLDDAVAYLERARRLGPNEPWQKFVLTALAQISMIKGGYEEALGLARQSLSVAHSYGKSRWVQIAANALLGRMDEARRHLGVFRIDSPAVTIRSIREGQPNLDPQRMAAILDGLRLAGLPEE
jgi:TolB-like protein/Tfp pilus assembly protein PilF